MTTTETGRTTLEAYLDALATGGPFADFLTEDVTFALVGTEVSLVGREPVVAFIRGFHEQAFDSTLEIGSLCIDAVRAERPRSRSSSAGVTSPRSWASRPPGGTCACPTARTTSSAATAIAAIRVYGLVTPLVEALTA